MEKNPQFEVCNAFFSDLLVLLPSDFSKMDIIG